MSLYLERFAYTPYGVFGKLTTDEFECYTVERPWLDNKRRESCIPEGAYTIQLGRYNRGGYAAYEVMGVPNRSLIKIHKGNTIDDVIGCIATGTSLGYIKGKWAVTGSSKAFTDFMRVMNDEPTTQLLIKNYKPEGNWG